MTVISSTTDASSHMVVGWHDIDWRAANRYVKQLQIRIVKATQQGKWRIVKNLQRLLTHSFWAKALAVRRVTENHGKRTAGVDGETWETPERRMRAIRELNQAGYRPSPLKRLYIPKSNGKMRPLSIPTMKDRAQQALHLLGLEPIAETTGDPNSYGFRKERSAADALSQCHINLARKCNAEWILEGDIKGCFDHISHEWLETHVPMDRGTLRRWLKCGYVESKRLYPTEEGTPQGGIASPVLANFALDGLEAELKRRFPRQPRGGAIVAKVNLVRYADDFVITGINQELLEKEVKPLVQSFLAERGLTLSEEKTRITHIDDGFDFLGANVRRVGGKVRITPSKKSLRKLKEIIREVLHQYRGNSAFKMLTALNPKLRGWANYFRTATTKRIYIKVDHYVFKQLWRWVKRRHPGKSVAWRKKKYFTTEGKRKWLFFVRDGQGIHWQYVLARIPIKHYVKVQSKANPFDPAWEPYFEARALKKMREEEAHHQTRKLFQRQKAICPECHQRLTEQQPWNIHHIIPKVEGGPDTFENLMLLHQMCHTRLHARSSNAKLPGPQGP